MSKRGDFEIAPDIPRSEWLRLREGLTDDTSIKWALAVAIFDRRMTKRFLDPADVLIAHAGKNRGFGFAIMAIDLLVVETLAGFRLGIIDHTGQSGRLFVDFLTRWKAFQECLDEGADAKARAREIYSGYRCALHHSGQTDGDLRIGVSGPMVRFSEESISINRTEFHQNLKEAHRAYLDELRTEANVELRGNFLRKMNAIAKVSG